jgi:hypothetical protein
MAISAIPAVRAKAVTVKFKFWSFESSSFFDFDYLVEPVNIDSPKAKTATSRLLVESERSVFNRPTHGTKAKLKSNRARSIDNYEYGPCRAWTTLKIRLAFKEKRNLCIAD